jgi:hypothetical protein
MLGEQIADLGLISAEMQPRASTLPQNERYLAFTRPSGMDIIGYAAITYTKAGTMQVLVRRLVPSC